MTFGRLAASRPASLVRLAYSRSLCRSSPRAWSRTVASSTSSALPSLARASVRRMADAVGAPTPVPLSPSGSVTSPLPALPRKSPMFEPYVAKLPPARGTPPRCGRGGCGAAAVSLNGLNPGFHGVGRWALGVGRGAGLGRGSEGAVVADGHAGAAARGGAAAQLDQAGHPVAVTGVGGEELEHAGVVGLAAGQRPADHVRQVVVADRDRVGVAHGTLPDLGRGPDADAGQRAQAAIRFGRVQVLGLL